MRAAPAAVTAASAASMASAAATRGRIDRRAHGEGGYHEPVNERWVPHLTAVYKSNRPLEQINRRLENGVTYRLLLRSNHSRRCANQRIAGRGMEVRDPQNERE